MDAGGGAQVRLVKQKVTSISELESQHGPYTAVIAAAGAANELISEIGKSFQNLLGTTPPAELLLEDIVHKISLARHEEQITWISQNETSIVLRAESLETIISSDSSC